MDDDTQLWGGAALIVAAGIVLFVPLVLQLGYSAPIFVVAVLALAAGALLVGLSRRGRAV